MFDLSGNRTRDSTVAVCRHSVVIVQRPASRVQCPESSVQSPASDFCVQSPGIPVCLSRFSSWRILVEIEPLRFDSISDSDQLIQHSINDSILLLLLVLVTFDPIILMFATSKYDHWKYFTTLFGLGTNTFLFLQVMFKLQSTLFLLGGIQAISDSFLFLWHSYQLFYFSNSFFLSFQLACYKSNFVCFSFKFDLSKIAFVSVPDM